MMERVSERWTRCKELLKHRLDEEDASTWLPPLELASLTSQKAVFHGIPNLFFKNRIQVRFAPLMRECLAEAFGPPAAGSELALDLRVGGRTEGLMAETPGLVQPERDGEPMARPAEPSGQAEEQAGEHGQQPAREGEMENRGHELSFDACIEGEANTAAIQLGRQIASAPGVRYNPFFLVGAVGLGKTHLLRVMGEEFRRARPGARVVYRTAEGFTNDVVDGIRRKRMAAVREQYRTADLLLLDDIQFIQVSERAQQELLHTFDALHSARKQVIFSADRFPGELTSMDATLRSRLEMGLVAELGPPDTEMRLALLRAKAAEHGLRLPVESAALLAEKIRTGFRQLEGALVRVAAYAALRREEATPAFVAKVAGRFFEEKPEPKGLPVASDAVLGRVCDHFGLTMKELRSRGRSAHLVKARRVASYLLREAARLSFPEIGAALGDRGHSTIFHAVKTIQVELETDPPFRKAVLKLLHGLKHPD